MLAQEQQLEWKQEEINNNKISLIKQTQALGDKVAKMENEISKNKFKIQEQTDAIIKSEKQHLTEIQRNLDLTTKLTFYTHRRVSDMATQTTRAYFADEEAQTDPITFGHDHSVRSSSHSQQSANHLRSSESESYKKDNSSQEGISNMLIAEVMVSSDTERSLQNEPT